MSKHRPISKDPLDIPFDNLYHAGNFSVDSGTVWIGDNCYKIGFTDKEYKKNNDEYFEKTGYNKASEAWSQNHSADIMNAAIARGELNESHRRKKIEIPPSLMYHEFPKGLLISTLYGDGSYPVYVEMSQNGSKVRRIIIDFDCSIESVDDDQMENE